MYPGDPKLFSNLEVNRDLIYKIVKQLDYPSIVNFRGMNKQIATICKDSY